MQQYLSILDEVLEKGKDREGRNGMTRSLVAPQFRFKFDSEKKDFPALTTKKLFFRSVVAELLWFIEGSSDDNRLKELVGQDKTIWTANAGADYWKDKARFPGDLGRIYGVQWRDWQDFRGNKIDQLQNVIDSIKNYPHDRRHVVTAWNPGELDEMALPPCHMLFQFYVLEDKLSLAMTQRSADMFLGVPFNIASYALLLCLVSQVTNLKPDELVITFNDAHIYHNHFKAVGKQLTREPLPLPQLWLNPDVKDIDSFTMDDIKLQNYQHHPAIRAKMIV